MVRNDAKLAKHLLNYMLNFGIETTLYCVKDAFDTFDVNTNTEKIESNLFKCLVDVATIIDIEK